MALTKEQNRALADKLLGTTRNVYREAEAMFEGYEFTEDDWDKLTEEADIFRCEICGEWLDKIFEDGSILGQCEECIVNSD